MELVYYNGDHSVSFGKGTVSLTHGLVINGVKNSWKDWGLIPASKPVIPPPAIKTKQVDIPGAHGTLDLTTVLTGYPIYSNRTGSLDFILAPGHGDYESVKTKIMAYLHGKTTNMYLSDDPSHYYTGIFTVSQFKSDSRLNSISINYNLYPFRKNLLMSHQDWLWDQLNFEIGEARSLANIEVGTEGLTLEINDCATSIQPRITSTTAMVVTHKYYTYDGEEISTDYSIPANEDFWLVHFRPGKNYLIFTRAGTVSIRYRGEIL